MEKTIFDIEGEAGASDEPCAAHVSGANVMAWGA